MVIALTEADRAHVAAAVTAAEAGTDGEIVTIVAPQSDAYHDVALHWAVLVLFLALALCAAFPDFYLRLLDRFAGWDGWTTRALLTILMVVLALKFLISLLILRWRPLRLALTPAGTKTRRVRRRAILLFRATAERRTVARTGVLLYLSLAERRAEIVADEGIHGKVAPEAWGEAMAALIGEVRAGRPGAGMAAAVAAIGAILAAHVPPRAENPNEIPDRLIEL